MKPRTRSVFGFVVRQNEKGYAPTRCGHRHVRSFCASLRSNISVEHSRAATAESRKPKLDQKAPRASPPPPSPPPPPPPARRQLQEQVRLCRASSITAPTAASRRAARSLGALPRIIMIDIAEHPLRHLDAPATAAATNVVIGRTSSSVKGGSDTKRKSSRLVGWRKMSSAACRCSRGGTTPSPGISSGRR